MLGKAPFYAARFKLTLSCGFGPPKQSSTNHDSSCTGLWCSERAHATYPLYRPDARAWPVKGYHSNTWLTSSYRLYRVKDKEPKHYFARKYIHYTCTRQKNLMNILFESDFHLSSRHGRAITCRQWWRDVHHIAIWCGGDVHLVCSAYIWKSLRRECLAMISTVFVTS